MPADSDRKTLPVIITKEPKSIADDFDESRVKTILKMLFGQRMMGR
jgi:hypothetical protein